MKPGLSDHVEIMHFHSLYISTKATSKIHKDFVNKSFKSISPMDHKINKIIRITYITKLSVTIKLLEIRI